MYINPGATASPSTLSAAHIYTDSTPQAQPAAPTSSVAITSAPNSSSLASSTLTTTSSSRTPILASPTGTDVPSGLSTGAKIGIGVGVAGGGLFLAAVGICCFLMARRRKNKKSQEVQQPPQYAQSPQMGSFMPAQQPGGWAPFPPQGMPYYVVPASAMGQKDIHSMTTSPAYSPPHSPPPPTELSTDHGRQAEGLATPQPHAASSPRLASMTHSEVAAARYA